MISIVSCFKEISLSDFLVANVIQFEIANGPLVFQCAICYTHWLEMFADLTQNCLIFRRIYGCCMV
jgi:hypothetical protein